MFSFFPISDLIFSKIKEFSLVNNLKSVNRFEFRLKKLIFFKIKHKIEYSLISIVDKDFVFYKKDCVNGL